MYSDFGDEKVYAENSNKFICEVLWKNQRKEIFALSDVQIIFLLIGFQAQYPI